MPEDALFLSVCRQPETFFKRLAAQLKEASDELRTDPKDFFVHLFKGDASNNHRRAMRLQFGLAVSLIIYALAFALVLILWSTSKPTNIGEEDGSVFVAYPLWTARPNLKAMGRDEHTGGGGGGGNQSLSPASAGTPPHFIEQDSVVAPTTRPQITPPLLPVTPTVNAPSEFDMRRDELTPMGVPNGIIGPPSDGPGSRGGFGSGDQGGVGPGKGKGYGPGNEKGIGDSDYSIGGKDSNHQTRQEPVDARPVVLNRPRPNYTEQARINRVQGTVKARILVGADGVVRQVRLQTHLPHGLDEEAIRAAMQMRFRPAMRGAQTVECWVTVDIEFNLR